MAGNSFVYVTYIKTTPNDLWTALIRPEFTQKYWYGIRQESEWTPGSSWKMIFPDGRIADAGEVVESDPPKRLVLKWQNQFKPELKEEGYSRCVFELEPKDDVVKLTITHTIERENSKFIQAVSQGWPAILSNLKSLLETGHVIMPQR
ncbi:MAG TPA: SRPBCC family protein [Rhizomicrobium sp.]|nr:SRPBCC family protein [Rhizomicrobium sp.]